MLNKKRVFSGIQPSGEIHIGNYLGALKQWISFQDKADCIYCIVDLHSLTVEYNPAELKKRIMDKAIAYLAAGLDPEKTIIFVQSAVSAHTELTWLLSVVTPIGDLQRMIQYKEKSKKNPGNINAGLLNYPILMAADILLYQTNIVPVGVDQSQHVELTREIAERFNKRFGQTFQLPKTVLPKKGEKIMSLKEPEKKMSKSDSPESCIFLFEEPESIRKKIMSAQTDSGNEIYYDQKKKPGISNLLTIYSLFSNADISLLEKEFQGKNYKVFKESLAQLLVDKLDPFRKKKKELQNKEALIQKILNKGAQRAEKIANQTLEQAKKNMGLV
jgi:tryptophanyl-tRNA synthetase